MDWTFSWLAKIFAPIINLFRDKKTLARIALIEAMKNNPDKRKRILGAARTAMAFVAKGYLMSSLKERILDKFDPADRMVVEELINAYISQMPKRIVTDSDVTKVKRMLAEIIDCAEQGGEADAIRRAEGK